MEDRRLPDGHRSGSEHVRVEYFSIIFKTVTKINETVIEKLSAFDPENKIHHYYPVFFSFFSFFNQLIFFVWFQESFGEIYTFGEERGEIKLLSIPPHVRASLRIPQPTSGVANEQRGRIAGPCAGGRTLNNLVVFFFPGAPAPPARGDRPDRVYAAGALSSPWTTPASHM